MVEINRTAPGIAFKSCPRCQGDLYNGSDMYGEYWECLQCGYMRDIEKPSRLFRHDLNSDGQRVKERMA